MRRVAFVLLLSASCAGAPERRASTETAPRATSASAPTRAPRCPGFTREPVDLGIEHASSLALGVADTCAVSDGNLVCVPRKGSAAPTVRMRDVLRAAGGNGRRVCALRTNHTLDCFDGGDERYEFSYFERATGDWMRHAKALALTDDDTLTLLGDDGSLRSARIKLGTDAAGRIVHFAAPSGSSRDVPARDVTDAHQIGGEAECVLVGDREICSSWRMHQKMAMPGPVAAIGGHCALLGDGRVLCFEVHPFRYGDPVVVATLSHATALASDDGQGGCALADGRWTCFGDLGLVFSFNGIGPFREPQTIATPEPVEEVAMLDGRACARTKSGRVLCFGCLGLR